MKKMNKKGFTIVELSIVIAVIAILAAILVPSFSSLIGQSKDTAA
jgi:type IV pilus assembly protein PilA